MLTRGPARARPGQYITFNIQYNKGSHFNVTLFFLQVPVTKQLSNTCGTRPRSYVQVMFYMLEFRNRIWSTVSPSSLVRRSEIVLPAALNTRSLDALVACHHAATVPPSLSAAVWVFLTVARRFHGILPLSPKSSPNASTGAVIV